MKMNRASRTLRPSARRAAVVVAGVTAVAVLAGCTGGAGAPTGEQAMISDENLPTYLAADVAPPEYPGANGSTPGYTTLPTPLRKAFDAPPGSGGSYTAMTPLWGTIPPTSGNSYFEAVNEAMGVDIDFQISDGTVYGDKLAAVLASPKDMADWVSIPTWNVPPRFGQAVDSVFEDLTPYLAGDLVEEYPNLANIPTEAWKTCSWNGKVYGLPFPQDVGVGNYTFYRSDLLPDATMPTNADEVIEFAKANTGDGKWASNDLWTTANIMFGIPEKWVIGEDGELVHRVETPQYRAALEWMTELYDSGAVHPDAVADNQGDAGQRFESGQVVMTSSGVGFWHEALTRNRASDPDFDITPFPVVAADGGDPVVYKSSGATMCSYLKKNDDKEAIGELLQAANFLASPFGTEEYQLINYGVEGAHYLVDEQGLPVPTTLAQTEVQPSYIFLVDPPVVNARVSLPDYVTASSEWTARNAEFLVEPPFYGMNVTEPTRFASLNQPFPDLEKDIARGRATIEDLDTAIETWRTSGGDDLREFYQEILDANPDAAGTGTPAS